MNFSLRDYQLDSKKMTYKAIMKGSKKIINWLDTGAGKGLLMADYAQDALKKGKKTLVVMRRRDLIFQTRDNFKKYRGINPSIIMGKEKGFDKKNPIQICSIDTLRNKIKKDDFYFLKDFNVIQIDECHDSTSPTYQKFFEFIGEKVFIGFTATPYSVGNKPLTFWDRAIKPINPSQLRDMGFKVPCEFYRPGTIDTTGIKKVNGDFKIKELFEAVTDLKIIGDAVDGYKKHGENKPFVGFCVNKAHSKLMAHAFSEAGIPAIHIDESHNKHERKRAKDDLESGKIKGIFNVDIFSTGWDCPIVQVMIGLRPTLSEILAIQQWGRVLRTYPGKKYAIILDHANNSSRFGFPYDDDRQACLTQFAHEHKKKEERKDEIKAKDCPECERTIESYLKKCPYCHHEFKAKEREIKKEEGELYKVDQESFKDKKLIKIQKEFKSLLNKEKANGWKKIAKFFILYDKCGDDIFNYMGELKIPKYVEKIIKDKKNKSECSNCKFYRFQNIAMKTNSRLNNIKLDKFGYCWKNEMDVKNNFFCIKFQKKEN